MGATKALPPFPPLPPLPRGEWRNGLWVEEPASIVERAAAQYSDPTRPRRTVRAGDVAALVLCVLALCASTVGVVVAADRFYDEVRSPTPEERWDVYVNSGAAGQTMSDLSGAGLPVQTAPTSTVPSGP